MCSVKIVDYYFDDSTLPQKLIVMVRNQETTPLRIEAARFTASKLKTRALRDFQDARNKSAFVHINREVNALGNTLVQFELSEPVSSDFLETMRGRLGLLTLRIPHEDGQVEKSVQI